MRRQLVAVDLIEFDVHDHVAWCGDGSGALHRLAVSAFSTAVRRGERMLFVSDDPHPAQLAGLAGLDALLDKGALQLTPVEATYGHRIDPAAQQERFEGVLDRALREGYSGLCVVADNSRAAAGSDDEFAAWLDWEAAADQLQAGRPINGVCYYDRRKVASERLDDLAAIHPIVSGDFAPPTFQRFVDGDTVRIVGELDAFNADRLRRVLSREERRPLVLDLSGVDFLDHRALLTINAVAGDLGSVRVLGAKEIVRRLWEILDVPGATLEFC